MKGNDSVQRANATLITKCARFDATLEWKGFAPLHAPSRLKVGRRDLVALAKAELEAMEAEDPRPQQAVIIAQERVRCQSRSGFSGTKLEAHPTKKPVTCGTTSRRCMLFFADQLLHGAPAKAKQQTGPRRDPKLPTWLECHTHVFNGGAWVGGCGCGRAAQGNDSPLCLVTSRDLGLLQENGCIAPFESARLPTHLRGGGVDKPIVSGRTTANEAVPRRNRGCHVASGSQ